MNYKGKYVFISHPFTDNPIENRKSVDNICKYLIKQGLIPISPLHLFSFYEEDKNREDIMKICYELIKISDVVFVFGDSEGCNMEREFANKINKPIEVFFNEDY